MDGDSAETDWSVARASASLGELAYFERAVAHVLAGWIPRVPDMALKVELGQLLYQAIDHATRLRQRLAGLTHADGVDLDTFPVPQGRQIVMRHLDSAQDVAALLAGLSRVVWPGLIELYRRHAASTHPLGDAGSVRLVRVLLPEVSSALEWAREAVTTASPTSPAPGFVEEAAALWATRARGPERPFRDSLWPPMTRVPAAARPAGLRRCEPGSLGLIAVDGIHEPEGVGMFLHSDLDEEYATLELMARNSYEHPDMPWAFHVDMARQASDEARHALMMEALLRARGFTYGAFPVSTGSYDGIYEFAPCEPGSRKELLWRILIRQTFMEGLALDSLAHDVRRRFGTGQDDVVRALEYILRDEVFHVRAGMRWAAHLLGDDRRAVLQGRYEAWTCYTAKADALRGRWVDDNPEKAMDELILLEDFKRRRGGNGPDWPLNRTGRLQAGQSEDDILQVLSWGFATEAARPERV